MFWVSFTVYLRESVALLQACLRDIRSLPLGSFVKNAATVMRQQVPVACVFSVALDRSMLGRGRAGSWNNSTVQIFDFYDLRSLDFYASNCTLSPSNKENNSSTFCLIIIVHFFCDSHIYVQWCLTGFFTCVSLMANDPEYLFTSSGAFQKLVPLLIFPRRQSQPLRMLPGISRQRAIPEVQAGPSKPRSTGQSLLCRAT